jgi:hypothetical protein
VEYVPLFRQIQFMEDKKKHFTHVLRGTPLAGDALGALQTGRVTASIAPSPERKPF